MAESEKERLDRELIELLNELRVALPGVQVLFAFLLAVPFTQRWEQTTDLQRNVFFAAIMFATVATALLIAPSSYHRLRWREGDKEQMLRTSNRLAIVGTAFLALSMTAVVFVVTDVVFDVAVATAVSIGTAVLFAWFWYGLALVRRARD
jgi:predicted membrane channel-forming protein YqfA (hemolysin III family)